MYNYVYLFYRVNLPALIIICTPLIWHYFIAIDIRNYIYAENPGLLFSRFICDAQALREVLCYDEGLYFSSYFAGLFLVFLFFGVHLLNLARDSASVVMTAKCVQFPLLIAFLCVLSVAFFFLALSTWSLAGPDRIGCSWFESVGRQQDFAVQYFKTLLLIGSEMGTIYAFLAMASIYFVFHVENRGRTRCAKRTTP